MNLSEGFIVLLYSIHAKAVLNSCALSAGNSEGTHLNWVCIIIWGLCMWGFVYFFYLGDYDNYEF